MIKDITLGQYYAGNSIIHRLDPRVKITAAFAFLILIFFVNDFAGYLISGVCVAAIILTAGIPLKFMIRGMKAIFFILVFTFILNLFLYKGTIIWQWWIFHITQEGLYQASFIAVRLILLIAGTSLLTYTTKPMALTDGFESLLRPLSYIKLPTHEIAMMMSIALRFIPTLLEETDKIMKAQETRGADFESGSLIQRAKSLIPILIPLFVSAFRIAQELATAMEARCYKGGKGRTRLHPMKYKVMDILAYLLIIAFAVIIILQSRGMLGLPVL